MIIFGGSGVVFVWEKGKTGVAQSLFLTRNLGIISSGALGAYWVLGTKFGLGKFKADDISAILYL